MIVEHEEIINQKGKTMKIYNNSEIRQLSSSQLEELIEMGIGKFLKMGSRKEQEGDAQEAQKIMSIVKEADRVLGERKSIKTEQ